MLLCLKTSLKPRVPGVGRIWGFGRRRSRRVSRDWPHPGGPYSSLHKQRAGDPKKKKGVKPDDERGMDPAEKI